MLASREPESYEFDIPEVVSFETGVAACSDPRFIAYIWQYILGPLGLIPGSFVPFFLPGGIRHHVLKEGENETKRKLALVRAKGLKEIVDIQHLDGCAAHGLAFVSREEERQFHVAGQRRTFELIRAEHGRVVGRGFLVVPRGAQRYVIEPSILIR